MKTFFVSSTFRDMHEERDRMHREIIPDLNDVAFKYGESIAICDLRWGVNTEGKDRDEANRKVLSVCMDQIDACRPYIIILLGERYGFCPGEKLIKEEIDKRNDLARAVGKGVFSLSDGNKHISVTELEIRYALSAGEPKVLCYERRFVNPEDVPAGFKGETEETEKKLSLLKEKIKKKGVTIRPYFVRWNGDEERIEAAENKRVSFAEMVKNDVICLLQAEWEKTGRLTAGQRERKRHWEYAREKEKMYYVRSQVEKDIEEKLRTYRFAVLKGGAGCGKSSIMSHLAMKLSEQKEKGTEVLALFCGYTPLTCSGLDLMKRIVEYLEELPGAEEPKEGEWDDFSPDWKGWRLRMEKRIEQFAKKAGKDGRRLVILIDAADQLEASEIRDNLLFVPSNLSAQVQMAVSCLEEFGTDSWKECVVEAGSLKNEEKKNILGKMFASSGKEAYREVIDTIVRKKNSDNPLYLSLLVQRLEMMDKEDFLRIDTDKSYDTSSAEYQKGILDECEETLEGMCIKILEKAAGTKLAEKSVSYLSASRYGLRETDLEGIFGEGWNSLDFLRFYKYMRKLFIVREDGRYDFSHRSIREGCRKKYAGGEKNLHGAILKHLIDLPSYDPIRISELPYHCYHADDKKYLVQYLCWKGQDGKMDDSGKKNALKAAARGVHELCILDQKWICSILSACDPWKHPEEAAGLLQFLYEYLRNSFADTAEELEIQKKIYREGLSLAEKLHRQWINESSAQILADICYALGSVCHRIGGTWNYSRALELYQREQELVYALSQKRRDGAYARQADSLIHLGDIYASMDGRENRNRALRMYRKAKEVAKQCGEKKKEGVICRKQGEILIKGRKAGQTKEIGSLPDQEMHISESPFFLIDEKEKMYRYLQMGDTMSGMYGEENRKSALDYYRMAAILAEKRKEEPPIEENLYDWLICRERIDFLTGLMHPEGSWQEDYRKSFEILEKMEGRWRKERLYRARAVLLEQTGSLLMRQGAGEAALREAERRFHMAEEAVRELCRLREDTCYRRDLMVICCKSGEALMRREEEGTRLERTVQKVSSYYIEADQIAEDLKKELGTAESRADYVVMNVKAGDLFAFLGGEKCRRMAEERYLKSLEEALALRREGYVFGKKEAPLLFGKIEEVSRREQAQDSAEQGTLHTPGKDYDGESSFELHCFHLSAEGR